VHVKKAYSGNIGTALLILDLSTRWREVVSLMPQPLYPLRKLTEQQKE
jgi:hypothetical protein